MAADREVLERVARSIVPVGATMRHLGTGGFACTFLVNDGTQQHALKIIDPNLAETSRVARELAALQRVDHPGVVKFLDFGDHDFEGTNYMWISMEFVEGDTLTARIAHDEHFAPAAAMKFIRGLVQAAAAIWQQDTAHRDLSPRNIMCRSDGTPVIVDLGLARHVDDETMTVLPTPGTPGWMSPEQVGSTPTHGDWRSDQFVLGSVAYFLLTRIAPFNASTFTERWVAPAVLTPRSVHSIDQSLPLSVSDVVARMMAQQPHRRYLRVDELLTDLDRAINELDERDELDETLPAEYYPIIGDRKSWAMEGFIEQLESDGVVVDARGTDRVKEFGQVAQECGVPFIQDPVTWFMRSAPAFQPAHFLKLPYSGAPALTGIAEEADRRNWCRPIWEHQGESGPDTRITPYFYAGEGEMSWIKESLACARTFGDFKTESRSSDELWTTVLMHWNWLADAASRDRLLTALTGQSMQKLYLLVHTAQDSFAPLADVGVLRGFRDVFEVMNSAKVPVVAGKRASSGLILLALGARGFSSGVQGNLMNSAPHPESVAGRSGQATDRIFIPSLLNSITVQAYRMMRQAYPDLVQPGTQEAEDLLLENSTLESLTTPQRIMLLRHNQLALRNQARELSGLSVGDRISKMRRWIDTARSIYAVVPSSPRPSDDSGFLAAWDAALS